MPRLANLIVLSSPNVVSLRTDVFWCFFRTLRIPRQHPDANFVAYFCNQALRYDHATKDVLRPYSIIGDSNFRLILSLSTRQKVSLRVLSESLVPSKD